MDNEKVFEDLLAQHMKIVMRYIHYRMKNHYDADDVIQETCLAAFKHFDELENHKLFKYWILSIARNQCNMWYRRMCNSDIVPIDNVADSIESPELVYEDTVSSILKKLPYDTAHILELTMDGYKQAEIAQKLGVPEGTVKSRLYYAKKQFRSVCPPEIISVYERGKRKMSKKDYTCGFPAEMPKLSVVKKDSPFFEVKFEEDSFIIPRVGNKNSEGTYRYPDKKLALVSTCYVPKKAFVHEVEGVKVCRDTYVVKSDRMNKNEKIWFTQLTDEYIRDLATVSGECDDAYPTEIFTFLEKDFDYMLNGRTLMIKENPVNIDKDGIHFEDYHIRYTMGVYDVTIGERTFETVKCIYPCGYAISEVFVDRNGRLVLLRWYERKDAIESDDERVYGNSVLVANGIEYIHLEDRIGEYVL